jgi:hypothetical protein
VEKAKPDQISVNHEYGVLKAPPTFGNDLMECCETVFAMGHGDATGGDNFHAYSYSSVW